MNEALCPVCGVQIRRQVTYRTNALVICQVCGVTSQVASIAPLVLEMLYTDRDASMTEELPPFHNRPKSRRQMQRYGGHNSDKESDFDDWSDGRRNYARRNKIK
jgi:lysine biosynthesis protein LysW